METSAAFEGAGAVWPMAAKGPAKSKRKTPCANFLNRICFIDKIFPVGDP